MENEQIMVRQWKEFVCSPARTRKGVYASISADGRIAINREVWNLLGCPKSVSLLYDEPHRTIGIRRASGLIPNTFPVVPVTDQMKRFWIRGRDFTQAAAIDITYCTRFLDPHLEDDTLVLDLNYTTRVLGPRTKGEGS